MLIQHTVDEMVLSSPQAHFQISFPPKKCGEGHNEPFNQQASAVKCPKNRASASTIQWSNNSDLFRHWDSKPKSLLVDSLPQPQRLRIGEDYRIESIHVNRLVNGCLIFHMHENKRGIQSSKTSAFRVPNPC